MTRARLYGWAETMSAYVVLFGPTICTVWWVWRS